MTLLDQMVTDSVGPALVEHLSQLPACARCDTLRRRFDEGIDSAVRTMNGVIDGLSASLSKLSIRVDKTESLAGKASNRAVSAKKAAQNHKGGKPGQAGNMPGFSKRRLEDLDQVCFCFFSNAFS